jgi:N,N-dimethylformamidase beta subunit-like, C-terminal
MSISKIALLFLLLIEISTIAIIVTPYQIAYTPNDYAGATAAENNETINLSRKSDNNIITTFFNTSTNQEPKFPYSLSSLQTRTFINNLNNLTRNSGHSQFPHVATAGTNVYVTWIDDSSGNRDLFFRRSTDNGNTFGRIINLSNSTGSISEPQLSVYGSNVYVTWEHIPEDNGGIFFARSNDNGARFEKPVLLGNNTGFFGLPQISAVGSNVYVTWRDATYGIIFKGSNDNGASFGNSINLSNNTGYSFDPKIAAYGNNVHVIWSESTFVANSIYTRASTDNGNTFGRIINLSNNATLTYTPDITLSVTGKNTSSNNHVYAIWSNDTFAGPNSPSLTDVIFRRSIDGGQTFGDSINLSDNSSFSFKPRIAAYGNNNVYLVWEENNQLQNGEILFRRSIDGGQTFGDIINLSDSIRNSTSPQIALAGNGNLYIIWQEEDNANKKGSIYLRSSVNYGATFGKKISLSGRDTTGMSANPFITARQNGNLYVVWNKNIPNGNGEIISFIRLLYSDSFAYTHPYILSDNSNTSSVAPIYKPIKSLKIALVQPTFTKAAYDNSFYLFYNLYNKTFYDLYKMREINITKHTNLLSSKIRNETLSVSPSSSSMNYLLDHLKWLMPRSKVKLLTDQDVDAGSIFHSSVNNMNNTTNNNSNAYDIIILGHQEYVTQDEYSNLKQFVSNGGLLFLLDANVFYAKVSYDKKNDVITLVKGHGWAFNGKSAWRSVNETWANETSEWVGSNFYKRCRPCDFIFDNNPFNYMPHEEQYITNPKAIKLLDYNALELVYKNKTAQLEHNNTQLLNYYHKIIAARSNSSLPQFSNNNISFLSEYYNTLLLNNSNASNTRRVPIAAYELDYHKGKVVAMGIYAEDIILDHKFNQFFDSLMLKYAKEAERS